MHQHLSDILNNIATTLSVKNNLNEIIKMINPEQLMLSIKIPYKISTGLSYNIKDIIKEINTINSIDSIENYSIIAIQSQKKIKGLPNLKTFKMVDNSLTINPSIVLYYKDTFEIDKIVFNEDQFMSILFKKPNILIINSNARVITPPPVVDIFDNSYLLKDDLLFNHKKNTKIYIMGQFHSWYNQKYKQENVDFYETQIKEFEKIKKTIATEISTIPNISINAKNKITSENFVKFITQYNIHLLTINIGKGKIANVYKLDINKPFESVIGNMLERFQNSVNNFQLSGIDSKNKPIMQNLINILKKVKSYTLLSPTEIKSLSDKNINMKNQLITDCQVINQKIINKQALSSNENDLLKDYRQLVKDIQEEINSFNVNLIFKHKSGKNNSTYHILSNCDTYQTHKYDYNYVIATLCPNETNIGDSLDRDQKDINILLSNLISSPDGQIIIDNNPLNMLSLPILKTKFTSLAYGKKMQMIHLFGTNYSSISNYKFLALINISTFDLLKDITTIYDNMLINQTKYNELESNCIMIGENIGVAFFALIKKLFMIMEKFVNESQIKSIINDIEHFDVSSTTKIKFIELIMVELFGVDYHDFTNLIKNYYDNNVATQAPKIKYSFEGKLTIIILNKMGYYNVKGASTRIMATEYQKNPAKYAKIFYNYTKITGSSITPTLTPTPIPITTKQIGTTNLSFFADDDEFDDASGLINSQNFKKNASVSFSKTKPQYKFDELLTEIIKFIDGNINMVFKENFIVTVFPNIFEKYINPTHLHQFKLKYKFFGNGMTIDLTDKIVCDPFYNKTKSMLSFLQSQNRDTFIFNTVADFDLKFA